MAMFPTYAMVIAASSVLVLLLIRAQRGAPPRPARALAIGWVLAHVALAMAGVQSVAVSNLMVLGSAMVVALGLARLTRAPNALVAFAVTASIVDIVSFSGGATRWLLTSESEGVATALRYLAVTFPTEAGLVAIVGVADLAFLGTFHVGLVREGAKPIPVAVGLIGALLVALVVGLVRGGAFGIPFMAAVVLIFAAWIARRKRGQGDRAPA